MKFLKVRRKIFDVVFEWITCELCMPIAAKMR